MSDSIVFQPCVSVLFFLLKVNLSLFCVNFVTFCVWVVSFSSLSAGLGWFLVYFWLFCVSFSQFRSSLRHFVSLWSGFVCICCHFVSFSFSLLLFSGLFRDQFLWFSVFMLVFSEGCFLRLCSFCTFESSLCLFETVLRLSSGLWSSSVVSLQALVSLRWTWRRAAAAEVLRGSAARQFPLSRRNQVVKRVLGDARSDGVHPVVPLVLAGGAESVRLVFPLNHAAFVLRLTGLDLLSSAVI